MANVLGLQRKAWAGVPVKRGLTKELDFGLLIKRSVSRFGD
jgi:hypothetical protein